VVVNFSGSVTSTVAALSVLVPPIISKQPVSLMVTQGNSAVFTTSASGVPPPSFQWLFNGTILSNATSSSFTISSAQAANAGKYSVIASNSAGTATSTQAVLNVLLLPTFPMVVTQPRSLTNTAGSTAQFMVVANGAAPLFYQWRLNSNSILGASSASYSLTNVQTNDAGAYDVIVANSYGSVVSAPAFLTVLAPPVIAAEPQSQTNSACSTATFSVTVDGSAPFTYHWNFNGADLPGATNATLTLTGVQPDNDGRYYVVVANAVGLAISSTVTLSVLPGPALTITNLYQTGSTFGFSFASTTGCTYITESKTGLADLSWTAVATNAGTGGMITNIFSTTTPSQFYRLRIE